LDFILFTKKSNVLVNKRRENVAYMYHSLNKYQRFISFVSSYPKSNPSWFSTAFTVKEDAPFTRDELVKWLELNNIETRPILGGNIIRQPFMKNAKIKTTELTNADIIHNNSFYVGAHPGLTVEMREYMVSVFERFFQRF
jgi:CDP-6-deoxy-D-xylo-4-hexulose-3-dehydrase